MKNQNAVLRPVWAGFVFVACLWCAACDPPPPPSPGKPINDYISFSAQELSNLLGLHVARVPIPEDAPPFKGLRMIAVSADGTTRSSGAFECEFVRRAAEILLSMKVQPEETSGRLSYAGVLVEYKFEGDHFGSGHGFRHGGEWNGRRWLLAEGPLSSPNQTKIYVELLENAP